MEYLKGTFTVAAAPSQQYRDNYDWTFRKVEVYGKLAAELRQVRGLAERDWEARETVLIETMLDLWHTMTPEQQQDCEKFSSWPDVVES